jgi:hypothetical protein
MDEEKVGRGPGAAVGPQRGPGAEAPYEGNVFFHELYSDCHAQVPMCPPLLHA